MSHSELATYVKYSPNCNKPRNHSIDSIAIHTMAGNLTVETCGEWFANPISKASSNYGIDSEGRIAVYVEEENRSWCTSSKGVDNRAITIEVASTTTSEPYKCTEEAYEALIKLLVDVCQRNNIYELKWKHDAHYGVAAAKGGPVRDQNMFAHRWFNTKKSCPGEYLFRRFDQIAGEVNTRLKSGVRYTGPEGTLTYSAGYAGDITELGSNYITLGDIDYNEYSPYLVTLTRNSNIQYNKLKDAGVIGAIVEAGYYFESNRRKAYRFDNQNIAAQIKILNQVELPYGLFMYARARNWKEAREEMYHLSFITAKYGAKLGVWLQLELGKNKSDNDRTMERYKDDLVKMGFKGKMGIIATSYQLSLISWDKWNDYFFLWYVGHVSSLDELDNLLNPEFFDMDKELAYYQNNGGASKT